MCVGKKKISCYSIKSLSTLVIRHLFIVYANERKPYGGCRMAFFGWDSWTQNRGFRRGASDALFTYAKTLSDARHRSGSSSLSQTIKRENADAFSLFMAGIAGLEPAMQESKSCALTDLAISHRYGLLYHIRRRRVKMTWVSCFLFWEVFEGYGELFRGSSP